MTCDPTPEAVPAKSKLFAPTVDAYGTRLALVFGNESKTGACPFYNHNCFHCDIGAGEGAFTPALNLQRLQYYRDLYFYFVTILIVFFADSVRGLLSRPVVVYAAARGLK